MSWTPPLPLEQDPVYKDWMAQAPPQNIRDNPYLDLPTWQAWMRQSPDANRPMYTPGDPRGAPTPAQRVEDENFLNSPYSGMPPAGQVFAPPGGWDAYAYYHPKEIAAGPNPGQTWVGYNPPPQVARAAPMPMQPGAPTSGAAPVAPTRAAASAPTTYSYGVPQAAASTQAYRPQAPPPPPMNPLNAAIQSQVVAPLPQPQPQPSYQAAFAPGNEPRRRRPGQGA